MSGTARRALPNQRRMAGLANLEAFFPGPELIARPKIKRPFPGTIGVPIFSGMEDLDLAGPWEVLNPPTPDQGVRVACALAIRIAEPAAIVS